MTASAMDTLVFRSRIDPLLAAFVFVPLVITTALQVERAIGRGVMPSPISIGVTGLVFALVAWIFAGTSYRVSDTMLTVRSGPMRVTVPLTDIRRVTRTRSVLSAPALSLRRLEVQYGRHSSVVISPDDEPGFLDALRSRAPQAELPGAES